VHRFNLYILCKLGHAECFGFLMCKARAESKKRSRIATAKVTRALPVKVRLLYYRKWSACIAWYDVLFSTRYRKSRYLWSLVDITIIKG